MDLDFSHPSFWNTSLAERYIGGDVCAQALPAFAPNGGAPDNGTTSVTWAEGVSGQVTPQRCQGSRFVDQFMDWATLRQYAQAFPSCEFHFCLRSALVSSVSFM